MPAKNDKKALLDKILKSGAFAHSPMYQNLLKYLVEASIRQETPKEYTIGREVLHRGPDFNPNQDTIVRVSIYNLRKKLDAYYSSEGAGDAVRIELPKGHYAVRFTDQKKAARIFQPKRVAWALLITALAAANVLTFLLYRKEVARLEGGSRWRDDPVWGDFFGSRLEKEIVLGDHFFYVMDPDSREKRTIARRDDINSNDEFVAFKNADVRRRNFKVLEYPVFPKNSVWPFADIIRLFGKANVEFRINCASNVTALEMKERDMLFVGSFHTLFSFNQTFKNSRFSYDVYPNTLTYRDDARDSLITLSEEGDPLYSHVDYGIARKIPGPNRNIYFIFTSFHETGTTGILQQFTDPILLKKVEDVLKSASGDVPRYFEILFKARGYNRTVYNTEIIFAGEIDPDSVFW
ncbi:hypothetical protein JW906_10225 [bacterium]|nr:hypothetical protein [bacterium]